ncbi:MAG: GNAT family N-acetyltransferase [Planctomycetaceae bacterium]|jgi:predicted N-acetyltransferase YhbS|nr:GNAT family N-acetyltransferase [Planctomycetaceae bacterium]
MAVPFVVRVVEESELGEELDRQIRLLLRLCFPDWSDIFQHCRTWHSTSPLFTVIVSEGEDVIGHIAVVVRTITTTWNFRYSVASIQGVCVDPNFRNSGIAHEMLRVTIEEAAKRGFQFAILYCKEHLVSFYTAQGWHLADESVVMWNQRDLPISMRSNCPMYYELSDVKLPEGPLDVHSPSW